MVVSALQPRASTMGSLPNLDHVLERREREKEKVLARERAREREFCHDLDSWRERVRLTIYSQQVSAD